LADEATPVQWQTQINCDFVEIGEEFSRKPYAIGVQKDSPLKEYLSRT
jgi:ionotropic glutamate receptor